MDGYSIKSNADLRCLSRSRLKSRLITRLPNNEASDFCVQHTQPADEGISQNSVSRLSSFSVSSITIFFSVNLFLMLFFSSMLDL